MYKSSNPHLIILVYKDIQNDNTNTIQIMDYEENTEIEEHVETVYDGVFSIHQSNVLY